MTEYRDYAARQRFRSDVTPSPDGRLLLTSGKQSLADTDLDLVDPHEPDAPPRVVTGHEGDRTHVAGPRSSRPTWSR
ncbi:hypothetical protein AB0H12_24450 [Actinosynnema sp. NPDC023794]